MKVRAFNLVPGAVVAADESEGGVYVINNVRLDHNMETVAVIRTWVPEEGDEAGPIMAGWSWDFNHPLELVGLTPNWDAESHVLELRDWGN